MAKTRFPLPPCQINPRTDKPYARHKWIIKTTTDGTLLHMEPSSGRLSYHVVCDRCGVVDPKELYA